MKAVYNGKRRSLRSVLCRQAAALLLLLSAVYPLSGQTETRNGPDVFFSGAAADFPQPVSGEFAFFRDYTFLEPTWIGILFYDTETWAARILTPGTGRRFTVFFTAEIHDGKMRLTGQRNDPNLQQEDVPLVNYLMQLLPFLWDERARAGNGGVSLPQSGIRGSFLPPTIRLESGTPFFGGKCTLTFAPEIPVRVHHGQKRARDAFASFPRGVVLTSYATLAADVELFGACVWRVIVADEAQQIKNRRSRNARSLKFLKADSRFVLTGTPIENSLEDLRSLFEFILPGFLPPTGTAHGAGTAERRERERENLRRLAAPYILRRTKSAVAPELPPRIEQTLWCRFGDAQARLYAEWKTRSREEFFKLEMAGASDARLRAATFSQLLRLRQICTEPRVVSPDFPEAENAKLRAFRELLDEAREGGHRMLVFSQFVSVLDFLADALESDGVPFCRIDGSTRERARECDRFNASPEIPVFLISLKAGGVGLNITGADVVVHYDPWWNPAAEAQATDRAHRIGQTRAVTSVKLAVADSVEERVLFLQREKRRLLEELFEASAAENAKISLAEMRELLK